MAEINRMTVDEVVSYFLEGEGVDVFVGSGSSTSCTGRRASRRTA